MVQDFILENQRLNTQIIMYLNSLNQIHAPRNIRDLNPMHLLYMVKTREHGLCY